MKNKIEKMINLKMLQSVLYNAQQVMAGYCNDDTWTDYDRKAHAELIKMQYIVEDELKKESKKEKCGCLDWDKKKFCDENCHT